MFEPITEFSPTHLNWDKNSDETSKWNFKRD